MPRFHDDPEDDVGDEDSLPLDVASLSIMREQIRHQKEAAAGEMAHIQQLMCQLRADKEAKTKAWEQQRQKDIAETKAAIANAEEELGVAREMRKRNKKIQQRLSEVKADPHMTSNCEEGIYSDDFETEDDTDGPGPEM